MKDHKKGDAAAKSHEGKDDKLKFNEPSKPSSSKTAFSYYFVMLGTYTAS